MCIFCGGACGGAGDVLLPAIAAAVPLLTLKIRAKLMAIKENEQKADNSDPGCDLIGKTDNDG
jgi:hypothetical protein